MNIYLYSILLKYIILFFKFKLIIVNIYIFQFHLISFLSKNWKFYKLICKFFIVLYFSFFNQSPNITFVNYSEQVS